MSCLHGHSSAAPQEALAEGAVTLLVRLAPEVVAVHGHLGSPSHEERVHSQV